jgi:energy-coupling factor transporter transmembrane protein EcfT
MVLISKILFFTSHHGFYTVILLFLILGLLSYLTKKIWFFVLALPLSILNGLCGQFLNAWFLNKYGVESTAIITSDVETNSTLNEMYIHDYEAVVKKQDGKYVSTFFSTTSATIYPIENTIRIPRMEISFPVKYIPGYEKNMVILYNESEEGKAALNYSKLAPVNSARIKYEADRTNKEFVSEYIEALENYTATYDEESYKTKLEELREELKQLK